MDEISCHQQLVEVSRKRAPLVPCLLTYTYLYIFDSADLDCSSRRDNMNGFYCVATLVVCLIALTSSTPIKAVSTFIGNHNGNGNHRGMLYVVLEI